MQKMTGPILGCAVFALALCSVSVVVQADEGGLKAVEADQPSEQSIQEETLDLLARANGTFKDFVRDPDLKWFQDNLYRAKGLMVIPTFYKGGFIIGASGGKGVMLARDRSNGEWLGPVFYSVGGVSLGLQAGGQSSEIVLMVMTDKGLDAMLSTKVHLGANASVAAGPVGTGAEAGLVDVYSFARSKGAFVGVSLEGAVMTTSDKRNAAYYGKAVSPISVLVTRHYAPVTPPAVVQSISYATRKQ